MTNRIADLRPALSTVEEADSAFRELALSTKHLAVENARLDRRIAELKAQHEERLLSCKTKIEDLRSALVVFIAAHKELFVKPRTRRTEQG
jgi:Mg-chelatase subunit ChlI